VFYLARALYAGEDPMFLARRIMICAAEDVGMANPAALQVAVAAAQAVHMVGMAGGQNNFVSGCDYGGHQSKIKLMLCGN